MYAKFCGLSHEAVFEISDGPEKGQVVRLPFADEDAADRLSPFVHELVNASEVKDTCVALHEALEQYLGADDRCAVETITSAAAVATLVDALHQRCANRD